MSDTQDSQAEEPAEALQPTVQPDEVEQLENDEQPEVDTQDNQAEEPAEEPAVDSKLKPFWVDGFGVVSAKSQADAEKRAKKIIAQRRK